MDTQPIYDAKQLGELVRGQRRELGLTQTEVAEVANVKATLVRRRPWQMPERIEAAIESARRSLPPEFQERPILDRVSAVAAERGELLAHRADEAA